MKNLLIRFNLLTSIGAAIIISQSVFGWSAPGQQESSLSGPGNAANLVTTVTNKSYQIPAGGASANLEGTACPADYKMISGGCHPSYNKQVPIINQFPNTESNAWRCGFANNTGSPVTVWIYTLCGKRGCQPPTAAHLAVTLRPQQTSMWCWAASGEMVMEYLGHDVAQCVEANNRFGLNNCCNTPTPNQCVIGGWPEFEKYGFTYQRTSGVALSWDELRKEIGCNGRPVAFSWGWPGGGGHMMVVIGYKTVDGVNYVEVNDPWAPNVGSHYFITYDYYVSSPNHHTHWDDFYAIQYTGR